jgi:hypothetical protein
MTRVCLNLSDRTAQRLKEVALRRTGSMKGLSEVGEEAIEKYLKEHYPRKLQFYDKKEQYKESKDIPGTSETLTEPAPVEKIQPTSGQDLPVNRD